MPTRKELIDQVRADQRARSSRARADNPKSAIVGIGDRDPKTGLFAVQTGDGSVEIGEKQFNSSLPNGNQVLGVPQSTGGWLLDERDVQPIKPPIKPSPMGNIKVLFSTIEGDERVFYVGGDLATPRRIYAIHANRAIAAALINNTGAGDRFLVSLSHVDGNGLDSQKITISFGKEWQVMPNDVYPTGHGFWTQTLGVNSIGATPLVSVAFDLVSRSQFLSDVREITGGRVVADGRDRDYPRLNIGSSENAIAPKLNRLTKYFLYQDNDGGRIGPNSYIRDQVIFNFETRRALVLGKKAASAIYESIDSKFDEVKYLGFINGQEKPPTVTIESFTNDAILVVAEREIKLGGKLPKNASDPTIVEFRVSDNLIKSKYYRVQLDSPIFGKPIKPEVDVHSLSANSTKKTIKAKMYGIPKPSSGMPTDAAGLAALTSQLRQGQPVTIGNVTIYNASYHP